MPEWEYRTINLSDLPPKTSELDLLREAGEDGWELVTITPNNIAYLKRQVRKPTAKSRQAVTT
jgi:hypothetical protein